VNLSADAVRKILGLKSHPTCGFVNETFRSSLLIPAAQLPSTFIGSRSMGSVLYFMVTREAQIVLHRIRSDQMVHHYLGDPLEVLLLYPAGDGEVLSVGPDLEKGMRPQLLIPAGTFHMSRLHSATDKASSLGYSLLGTSEWPGVDLSDVELGIPEKLMEAYPHMRYAIAEFTGRMKGVQESRHSSAA
jgi:predicted cupin superfamily sugar epimerase